MVCKLVFRFFFKFCIGFSIDIFGWKFCLGRDFVRKRLVVNMVSRLYIMFLDMGNKYN